MLEIDGSFGEGGGQIIRTAVALSALSGKAVRIKNIRAKRENPGLRAQHMNAVKAVAELCNAKVHGLEVGSNEIVFEPGKIIAKPLNIDVGTAGSTTLVLQAILPAALHADNPVKLKITGGTDNEMAPDVSYLNLVFIPALKKFGAKIELELIDRGYYPKGGGRIELSIHPSKLEPIEITKRGNLLKITGVSNASEQLKKAEVAERQAIGATRVLKELEVPVEIKKEYWNTLSVGTGICIAAIFEEAVLGATCFGKLGKKAEAVGKEAGEKLLKEINSGGCVDSHLSDQLLIYMALWGGQIRIAELTQHTKTNIWVIEQFLPVKFEVDEGLIKCKKL